MRNSIHAPGAVAVGPYSHAIATESLVICSGQTPLDPATGQLANGGIGAQTAQCFANLFAVLEGAGLDESHVVKVNVYLTDMETFAEMNATYETMFSEPYPARTTIGVASLPLGANVEIELIAQPT